MVTNKECLRGNDGSDKDSLTKYDGHPTETVHSLYLGLLSTVRAAILHDYSLGE